MRPNLQKSRVLTLLLLLTGLATSGCAALMSNAASGMADSLSSGILNHNDPDTVREGIPSYMIMMDGFVHDNPDDPAMLGAAAYLYASFGAGFVDDPARASRITTRGRDYALRAVCIEYAAACDWRELTYDEFVATLDGLGPQHADAVYTYSFATLAFLRAHSSDWNSLAELPQSEALVKRYLDITGSDANSSAHTYLGILLTLRPPALGGKPEEARQHFEKAIEMSGGRDLSAKVEFAKGYAKLLYDQELHDHLIGEVLESDPDVDGMTLSNVLAQQEALRLQAEAYDYF